VFANVGPTEFYGDTLTVAPNDLTIFVQSTTVSSLQHDSFTVSWTAPLHSQDITGYRVWASVGKVHNGYEASINKTLVYTTELRPNGQMLRSVVGPSTMSHTFTGCYNTPDGAGHCVSAWTLYEVYIEPITATVDGAPVVLTVLTAEDVPTQPTDLTAVCSE
jgi:hypothetical protein